jgi:hypothetical protein
VVNAGDGPHERRERNQGPGTQPGRPHGGRGLRGSRRVLRRRRDRVPVLVAVVAVITGGAGVLAYLAAWAIIPKQGEKASPAENIASTKQDASAGR